MVKKTVQQQHSANGKHHPTPRNKIKKVKSNWYLFRRNAWVAYAVLVLAAFFNWDLLITHFNVNRAINQQKQLDQEYLLSLSATNLPDLLQLQNQSTTGRPALQESEIARPQTASLEYTADSSFYYKTQLHRKLVNYKMQTAQADWQSWNKDNQRVTSMITLLEKGRNIPELHLPQQNYQAMPFVAYFPRLRTLNLRKNEVESLKELNILQELQELDISANKLNSINSLPPLPQLKILNISENDFSDVRSLQHLPALEKLDVSKTQIHDLNALPALPSLNYLNLSYTNIPDYGALIRYPKLQFLLLKNCLRQPPQPMPVLPSVRWLDISANNLYNHNQAIFKSLAGLDQVTHLDMSSNHLESLTLAEANETSNAADSAKVILKPAKGKPALLLSFQQLESLNLANNELKTLAHIQEYTNLRKLYVNGNKLQSLEPLIDLSKLEVLNLQRNGLVKINSLVRLTNLQELDLSGNTIYLEPSVLNQLPQLQKLNLAQNQLNRIDVLSKCISLRYLDLSHNHITSLNSCRWLKSLEYLRLNDNPVQDYSALYGLKKT